VSVYTSGGEGLGASKQAEGSIAHGGLLAHGVEIVAVKFVVSAE
jgi:hypothetical protein